MAFDPFGASGGRTSKRRSTKRRSISTGPAYDVQTIEGLERLAAEKGYELKAREEPKLSFLQRLGRGLSVFEPANAIYRSQYEDKNLITIYLTDVLTEAGSAISGKELRKEKKKTFKDILVKEGMSDRAGKVDLADVFGFAGDVVLDPSNLFGGKLIKGVLWAGEKGVRGVAKAGEKIAPRATMNLIEGFDKAKDALGRNFVYGYNTSKVTDEAGNVVRNLSEDVVDYQNKMSMAMDEVGKQWGGVFDGLPKEIQDDIVEGMYNVRKEFAQKRGGMVEKRLTDVQQSAVTELKKSADTLATFKEAHKFDPKLSKKAELMQQNLLKMQQDLADDYTRLYGAKNAKDILKVDLLARKPTAQAAEEIMEILKEEPIDNALDSLRAFQEGMSGQSETAFQEVTRQLVKEFNERLPTDVFKEKESIKFFTDKLYPQLQKMAGDVEKNTGLGMDMMMKYYYPFLKNGDDATKALQSFNSMLRTSKMGYIKQLQGKLSFDDLLKNAPEAYARRAADIAKDGVTKETLQDWVTVYGLPKTAFKNVDEARAAGYRMIKDKGIFGNEIGYLKEQDHRFISDIFDPSFKFINDLAKNTGFDWITNLFKKSVTGLFPSFHARNAVSGVLQNYQVVGPQALNPANISDGLKLTQKMMSKKPIEGTVVIDGVERSIKELVEPFKTRFNISSQYISDYGIEGLEKIIQKKQPLNMFEHARVVGNYVETQQKATAYVALLRKGYSVEDALRLTERAGFDYSKMTPFEKNVMRRLIPFYSFSRKNVELFLKTMRDNPERIGHILKAGRSLGTPQTTAQEEGEVKLPEWMRNKFVADLGINEVGLPQFAAGFGTPIEDIAELQEKGLMGVLSRLNPAVKVPLERATGRDFFLERDLKEVYSAKEYGKAPQILKDFLQIKEVEKDVYEDGKKIGTRTKYIADPDRYHIARNMFTSRGISYLHSLFGDEELTQTGKVLKATTGIKVHDIDEQSIQYFEDRDTYRDFVDLLQRLNLVKTFERAYIPKDQK